MNNEMKEVTIEEQHKEIDLIQSCITRMANNSFMIKGWLITIYAVVLALLPEKINIVLLCVTLLTITWAFWYLDGFFLRTEKVYRKIYDWVLKERPNHNRELLYQLNPIKFDGKTENTESIAKVMWSKTLRYFYGIPFAVVLLLLFVQLQPIACKICSMIQA